LALFCEDRHIPAIYTLSLHDALPIWLSGARRQRRADGRAVRRSLGLEPDLLNEDGVDGGRRMQRARDASHSVVRRRRLGAQSARSEEHTSELQSRENLVCRLLLEKKK